jgi:hypothetical protein
VNESLTKNCSKKRRSSAMLIGNARMMTKTSLEWENDVDASWSDVKNGDENGGDVSDRSASDENENVSDENVNENASDENVSDEIESVQQEEQEEA